MIIKFYHNLWLSNFTTILLKSVIERKTAKEEAKEFTWEKEQDESVIAKGSTWRRRLFYILREKYACVIDTSAQYHTNATKFLQDLLPGIKSNSWPFIFSGVPDILVHNQPVCTLSQNGDLQHDVLELKRTDTCTFSSFQKE